ncbi:MAG: sigma-70 family RNA polymerase sigma factor [Myxococcales bacterium]|nr:sigma-70 family RNA polymerase sigma factor [Myxococcales bacterium]
MSAPLHHPPSPAAEVQAGAGRGTPVAAAPPAFAQVFLEYSPQVIRVLRRLGVAEADIEDVAQEVFLAVHRALPRFEGRAKVSTWIYTICIRVSRDYRSKAYRRLERPAEVIEAVSVRDPERVSQGRRALMALDRSLAQLPREQREVFVMHEIESIPIREVAAAVGGSKFAAYRRLYAARRFIRQALKDHIADRGDHGE